MPTVLRALARRGAPVDRVVPGTTSTWDAGQYYTAQEQLR
jgi:hypothetical protein